MERGRKSVLDAHTKSFEFFRFSSGDLTSEFDDGPPSTVTSSKGPGGGPPSSRKDDDLSLNLRGVSAGAGGRTISAPTSPAKSRESFLQKVSQLTSNVVSTGTRQLEAAVARPTSSNAKTLLVIDDH